MIEIGYTGAFLGGVATILSPCSVMLFPAFFAYAFTRTQTLIARTAVFWLGLLLTLVPLGVAAGTVGALFTQHRDAFILAVSVAVIVLGLVQASGIAVPGLGMRHAGGSGVVSILLLGMTYGIAGTCSGPILGSVLGVAALGQDAVRGGVLLAIFSLGMVVPLVVLALLWDALDLGRRTWLKPRPVTWGPISTTVGQLVSGLMFVLIGVLMIATDGLSGLGGILDASTQQTWEVQILGLSAGVGDVIVVVLLAVLVAGAVGVHRWASAREGSRS